MLSKWSELQMFVVTIVIYNLLFLLHSKQSPFGLVFFRYVVN